MSTPRQLNSQLYVLIRDEELGAFNTQRPHNVDLSNDDFRGLDLPSLNPNNIDFSNAYFSGADLRGFDLRTCLLEGASLAQVQILGTYFPTAVTADEILISVNFGTRLRYRTHQPFKRH
ncbi:pentapeptide repeat-containing protein [Ectopseudomonas mendocina]|uniref:Pentapeptide repeat-containing protein n=1 Tax=Ectopseudomonas mendocina TaxID=300 RepID=A0ABZ2RMX6_ECTME